MKCEMLRNLLMSTNHSWIKPDSWPGLRCSLFFCRFARAHLNERSRNPWKTEQDWTSRRWFKAQLLLCKASFGNDPQSAARERRRWLKCSHLAPPPLSLQVITVRWMCVLMAEPVWPGQERRSSASALMVFLEKPATRPRPVSPRALDPVFDRSLQESLELAHWCFNLGRV